MASVLPLTRLPLTRTRPLLPLPPAAPPRTANRGVGPHLRRFAPLILAAPLVPAALSPARHTANARLLHEAGLIRFGSNDLHFVGHLSAPLPAALVALGPHSLIWPALLGALAAGSVLASITARLISRGTPPLVVALLAVSFAATPGLASTATTNLPVFLALALLIHALDGFRRIAFLGQSLGGLRAGLAIGFAALCHPIALPFAAAAAVTAPLVAYSRYRDERAAGRATAAVLLFPTVASLFAWTFLTWRFAGDPWALIRLDAPFVGFTAAHLHAAIAMVPAVALACPLFVVATGLLLLRRPRAAIAAALPLAVVAVGATSGLLTTSGEVAIILSAAAIAALPSRPGPRTLAVVIVIACAKIVLALTGVAFVYSV